MIYVSAGSIGSVLTHSALAVDGLLGTKKSLVVDANNLGTFYSLQICQPTAYTSWQHPRALVDSAGELITSEGQKADMFNVYFGSVCITDNGINPRCPVSETTSVHETVTFTQQEVLMALSARPLSSEDRAKATANMCKKFWEVRTCDI